MSREGPPRLLRSSDDTDAFCRSTVRAPVPSGPRSRLYRHCDELFTFLDDPRVPADNNGTERDIRSLAAAPSDGGTHRADWSAAAFARLKSVIVTQGLERLELTARRDGLEWTLS